MLNDKQIRDAAQSLLPAMRSMFGGLCRTKEDAEDETHEGYHYLVTYVLPNYRGGSNVKTFALQSLRRRYYRECKLHSKTKRERVDAGMDAFVSEGSTAFARLAMAQRLRNALKVLAADERALCEAFMKCGTWVLAADEIGVSDVKASRMLKRIRAKVA
jgi:RNA polymerase sigma factor (sigma-70 family)